MNIFSTIGLKCGMHIDVGPYCSNMTWMSYGRWSFSVILLFYLDFQKKKGED